MASNLKKNIKTSVKKNPNLFGYRLVGRLMVIFGILILGGLFTLTQFQYLSPSKKVLLLEQKSNDKYPVKLRFESLNKNFTIVTGSFSYGEWQTDEDNPIFLDSSSEPGSTGNMVIYGHNKANVFGDLNKLKLNERIIINTNYGEQYTYSIDSIRQVFPNQVEVLTSGGDKRITLFTCSGIFDSMRLIVSAKIV